MYRLILKFSGNLLMLRYSIFFNRQSACSGTIPMNCGGKPNVNIHVGIKYMCAKQTKHTVCKLTTHKKAAHKTRKGHCADMTPAAMGWFSEMQYAYRR